MAEVRAEAEGLPIRRLGREGIFDILEGRS